MKKILSLGILFSLMTPLFSHATAMSESKSRCLTLEGVAHEHALWAKSFQDFIWKYDSINDSDRFTLSNAATKKVLSHLKFLKRVASLNGYEKTISAAEGTLANIRNDHYSQEDANQRLRFDLVRLHDAMTYSIYDAQAKYPECTLENGQRPKVNTQAHSKSNMQ